VGKWEENGRRNGGNMTGNHLGGLEKGFIRD
jgi:hypothetical protein